MSKKNKKIIMVTGLLVFMFSGIRSLALFLFLSSTLYTREWEWTDLANYSLFWLPLVEVIEALIC